MNSKRLIRWSHLALILGGILQLAVPFFFHTRDTVGWVLVILGLVGLHMRQAAKAEWLGHAGIGLILVSAILPLLSNLIQSSSSLPGPFLLTLAAIQLAGLLIYGVATLRANALPRAVGYLVLLSVVTLLLAGIGISVIGIVIGFILWQSPDTREASLTPATNAGNRV